MLVSIPLWFDSNGRETKAKLLAELFQFHSGSIQTLNCNLAECLVDEFQFHSGSIQTFHCSPLCVFENVVSIPLWFDSNTSSSASSIMSNLFQFHSGSIQTQKQEDIYRSVECFNSTLVRFKLSRAICW